MTRDAVWITGIGASTPLGSTYSEFADNLLAGKSATRAVVESSGGSEVVTPASVVEQISIPRGWREDAFSYLVRTHQFTLSCASAALIDAGWYDRRSDARVGLVLGTGAEWLQYWELDYHAGGRRIYTPEDDDESNVGFVARSLQLRGPATTVAAACASSNYALALGRNWIRSGLVDVCLAGGCDINTPMCRANFRNLRALSKRVNDPQHASRPFDRDRDGLVMGEGCVFFLLESASSARRRRARSYAEVAGFGASSDGSHMIIPSSDPRPAAAAMQQALNDTGIGPEDVSYINAHATSTPVGDRAETRALQLVFGQHTSTTPVSSTKSMTGHLLSAAAAVEALACIVAIDRQAAPPTINLDNPDPECDLCHVPHQAQPRPIRTTLSNSFGFGGSNTSLVLRQVA